MRIIFFGTPAYVLPVLESLHKRFKEKDGVSPIVAVVTQKPKPTGRKKQLGHSSLDTWAHKREITIFHKASQILDSSVRANIGVLASYGEIIPKRVINFFSYGIINVHPSLLPKYRGASPVQSAIAAGETTTGITIMKLDELVDHGPILTQVEEKIKNADTTETLRNRLFKISAGLLTEMLPVYLSNKIKPKPQKHKSATFTSLIKKGDAFIPGGFIEKALAGKGTADKWGIPFVKDLKLPVSPKSVEQFIRATSPWPIAWTNIKLGSDKEIKRLKVISAHLEGQKLVLDEVQLEGKSAVSWRQFSQGYPMAILV